ncbi:DUF2628 domain-containing protein [Acetobacteraceae bacterium KSS8]|uniref:DUF2628 domain-containing protein n=1 Tax=Endosaccharibacter trunci TaxID=2812733 RepID=A0ABT1WBL9_9PROT|nr:DUF2628 domain-containing protein [Acetobacteraceae bacterium KSS8]
MRVYAPWFPPPGANPSRPPVMVRESFSVWGLVFGWLVFLRRGSWLCALLACAATVLAMLAARHVGGGWSLLLVVHVAIGAFAADWRGWEMKQGGWSQGPLVSGLDRGHALVRLLDKRPELVSRPG